MVPSKPAVVGLSSPADAPVAQRDVNSSGQLQLPVAATRQAFSTQNLLVLLKPVGVIGVRLLRLHERHLPVVVGQFEVLVHRVGVDRDFTGI